MSQRLTTLRPSQSPLDDPPAAPAIETSWLNPKALGTRPWRA